MILGKHTNINVGGDLPTLTVTVNNAGNAVTNIIMFISSDQSSRYPLENEMDGVFVEIIDTNIEIDTNIFTITNMITGIKHGARREN